MWISVQLLLGLFLLVFGAEWLVRGASRLALAVGIPPLIIGLTVVAFGTSAPELAVSVKATWEGSGGIAVGNVFGSNIVNILLVLGVSAIITPLVVSEQLVRVDVPIMVGASLAMFMFALDGSYSRIDGMILAGGLVAYLLLQFKLGRSFEEDLEDLQETEELVESRPRPLPLWKAAVMLVIGFVFLTLGANWIVEGASALARIMGIRDEIIGLTVVSIGTSLPEIVTSIIAAIRNERELAIGNVVGSNIFNIFAVLGISCSIAPSPIELSSEMLSIDLPIVFLVAAICIPIFMTGRVVSRREGVVMFSAYLAYLGWQIIQAIDVN